MHIAACMHEGVRTRNTVHCSIQAGKACLGCQPAKRKTCLLLLLQVRWSNATPGLPLRVEMCTRRFNFLKKHSSSSLFIASLEAQVPQ